MSLINVCDITGDPCNDTDSNEYVIQETDVQYQGKSINVELIVRVNVAGAVPKTNIAPSTWPPIMAWVKNKLNQVFP